MLVAGLKLCKGAKAYQDRMVVAKIVCSLCSRQLMGSELADQHISLLAQMQTSTYLSSLLCPVIDEKNEDRKAQGDVLCFAWSEAHPSVMPSDLHDHTSKCITRPTHSLA